MTDVSKFLALSNLVYTTGGGGQVIRLLASKPEVLGSSLDPCATCNLEHLT